ncbi:MAG TPA: preprotein translocase subunit SecG [Candidatus Babeliales bacterium]|jgi:preprotein translocase subunit SecG|nr:preprotein translocase subunit SecG [Candidatus Babeliales bacterium]
MFLFALLMTIYCVVCFLLVLIILIQKGKSSMGIGAFGGSSQMLFGGSGGQDIFQKITWVLGTIFMFSSLLLALMKSQHIKNISYTITPRTIQTSSELPK